VDDLGPAARCKIDSPVSHVGVGIPAARGIGKSHLNPAFLAGLDAIGKVEVQSIPLADALESGFKG
jgi:hypothetical protein